jgi:hypothetical protein
VQKDIPLILFVADIIHKSYVKCLEYKEIREKKLLKCTFFWDITPYTLCFHAVSSLAYSILKMEAKCYSETSVDFQRTTRRYMLEDNTVRNYSCENLKYYTGKLLFGPHVSAFLNSVTAEITTQRHVSS